MIFLHLECMSSDLACFSARTLPNPKERLDNTFNLLHTMKSIIIAATVLFASTAFAQTNTEPQTVVVRLVDKSSAEWRFEPSHVTVRPGDTIQWVLEDMVPHNVEFKKTPDGADLGDAKMGPFLMSKGQTYELVIDERFTVGAYNYVCTPHEAMGMKGSITVDSPNSEMSTH